MSSSGGGGSGEEPVCRLIGGGFATLLQIILGFAALAALLVKRWQEVPKRPSRVWLFDVSKQVAGGVFLHLWNILFSLLLVDLQKREGGGGGADEPAKPTDECALYFMEFFLDSFLGLLIMYILINVQELVGKRCGFPSIAVSGDYGTPASFTYYRHQLAAYMLIVFVVKTVVSVVVVSMSSLLASISAVIFAPVAKNPELELTLVMIICPWFLNAISFWIIDSIIMKPAPGSGPGKYDAVGGDNGSDDGGGAPAGPTWLGLPPTPGSRRDSWGRTPSEPVWLERQQSLSGRGRTGYPQARGAIV